MRRSSLSVLVAVVAARGVYAEGTLDLEPGVSLYGLFDGPPAWGRAPGNTTVIQGPDIAVRARDIQVETHLEGFEIVACDATGNGRSSYAIHIQRSKDLVIASAEVFRL
ncbi:MAG: hypothetical protein HY721_33105 [Planctomycetes bacterium]|nr:hypothetical protein [Planctomycetota bacterium]